MSQMSAVIFYQNSEGTAFCRAFLHLYYTQPLEVCQAVFCCVRAAEFCELFMLCMRKGNGGLKRPPENSNILDNR